MPVLYVKLTFKFSSDLIELRAMNVEVVDVLIHSLACVVLYRGWQEGCGEPGKTKER